MKTLGLDSEPYLGPILCGGTSSQNTGVLCTITPYYLPSGSIGYIDTCPVDGEVCSGADCKLIFFNLCNAPSLPEPPAVVIGMSYPGTCYSYTFSFPCYNCNQNVASVVCQDSPIPIPDCGDGVCVGPAETFFNCPVDCSSYCGDGYCHIGLEDLNNCPSDC